MTLEWLIWVLAGFMLWFLVGFAVTSWAAIVGARWFVAADRKVENEKRERPRYGVFLEYAFMVATCGPFGALALFTDRNNG